MSDIDYKFLVKVKRADAIGNICSFVMNIDFYEVEYSCFIYIVAVLVLRIHRIFRME